MDLNNNQIVSGNVARFPLCFPNGFPHRRMIRSCYHPRLLLFRAYQGSLPCLPPIINGQTIPPCHGQYVDIQSYMRNKSF